MVRVNKKIILLLLLLCSLLIPQNGYAIPSSCVIELHQHAINSAVILSPPELKDILSQHLKAMEKEIRRAQSVPASQRDSTAYYYNSIIDIAKGRDSQRYEYMSRAMSAITTDIFYSFSPIKDYEYCNSSSILKNAAVVFNGYALPPDYLKYQKINFNPSHEYKDLKSDNKLLRFYNLLVNEILNTWISIWYEAGRDISGLPAKYAVLKGESNTSMRILLSNDELRELGYSSLDAKPADALKAFSEILHFNKSDVDALYGTALAQYKLKDYQNSLNTFKAVGNYKDSLYYHGLVAEYLGSRTTDPTTKMNLFADSFMAFDSYCSSKQEYCDEANKKAKETGMTLLPLYERLINEQINLAKVYLNSASRTSSRSISLFEFEKAQEYSKNCRKLISEYYGFAESFQSRYESGFQLQDYTSEIDWMTKSSQAIDKKINPSRQVPAQAANNNHEVVVVYPSKRKEAAEGPCDFYLKAGPSYIDDWNRCLDMQRNLKLLKEQGPDIFPHLNIH